MGGVTTDEGMVVGRVCEATQNSEKFKRNTVYRTTGPIMLLWQGSGHEVSAKRLGLVGMIEA